MNDLSNSKVARKARARRKAEGRRMRLQERASFAAGGRRVPTHKQLLLPLLEALSEQGGAARPADVYDSVAEKAGIDEDIRDEKARFSDGQSANLWERHVRWARQTAVEKGLLSDARRGIWEMTDDGRNLLKDVRRGIVVTVFMTDSGTCLWANAEDAAALIAPGSVDLIMTSPMFPHVTDKRGYGTMEPAAWLDWITDLGFAWKDLLTESGSLIIHLGDVWYRGSPTLSAYIERFVIRMLDNVGLNLAQRLYAEHPTRLPAPRPWVAIRRVRVKPTVDPILWFSKSLDPKASNWGLLKPYGKTTEKYWIGNHEGGGYTNPSGHDIGKGSFATDNGGAIPGSVIRCTGQDKQVRRLRKRMREAGLPPHPAIMPREMADFAVRLTTEPGDLVYDPFFGSGTVGDVAESLGRDWIGSERSLEYLRGAALRFDGRPGFETAFSA